MKTTEMIKSIEEALTRARGARKSLKSLLRAAYSGMPDWAAPSNADGYFRAQERLLKEGRVRMASVVQANRNSSSPAKSTMME